MKFCKVIGVALVILLMTAGCVSRKVEFFQRKVKPVPTLSAKALELQREAAQACAEKTQEVVEIVTQERCEPAIPPAQEARDLAQVVAESVGAPQKPPQIDNRENVEKLIRELRAELGRLQRRLDLYREAVQRDVGKDIEGTGLIQFNYFQLAIAGLGIILLITILWRAFGIAIAAANPVVGFGVKTAQLTGKFAARALAQVISGGTQFLKELDDIVKNEELKKQLIQAFKRAHKQAQDQDVQQFIKNVQ